jgi:DNA-binding response OmpR family regulator
VIPPTILVADDEPHILLLIVITLRKDGYRILEANDGGEAFDLVQAERPDVLVLDAQMPHRSGFDVCADVRADVSLVPQPYVIMLTAAGQEADRRRAAEVGVDEFMAKPFSPSRLRARVREIIAERGSAGQV